MRPYRIRFLKKDLNHLLLLVPSDKQELVKNAYTKSTKKYDYKGTVMELKSSVKEDDQKDGEALRYPRKADASGGRI